MTNAYCDPLGIEVPRLERMRTHPKATAFSLLLVALLERGGPMTLAEVAERIASAGVAPAADALRALQRCRPARPPVWRDGDQYALDPHDAELDLRVFMLGLRPPRFSPAVPRAQPPTLPGPDHRLTAAELDEACKDIRLFSWSRQRLVLAVLDAHGEPLRPDEVIAFVEARARWHGLTADPAIFKQSGSAVEVRADGRWAIASSDTSALASARTAVRQRLAMVRRWVSMRPDPAEIEARQRLIEKEQAMRAGELANLRRVILHGFPAQDPEAVVLLDVGTRAIDTFVGEGLGVVKQRLDEYDIIAAVDVRPLLRAIDYQPRHRRLADLGPPQKRKQLNKRGRTLKITTELLIQGSCGISRPLGSAEKLRSYLRDGDDTRLRRRLEADAKSLYAFYQYGRLHGSVRLRWGFLDERIPAPWVHHDEPTLYVLKKQALELGIPVEIVAGSAPGWSDPWSRARRCTVHDDTSGWWTHIVSDDGYVIDDAEVQLARIVTVVH